MKKRLLLILSLALAQSAAFAQYTTSGDGTSYTIASLSGVPDAGIISYEQEEGMPLLYELFADLTIAAGDKFVMDDDIMLLMAEGVSLTIEGEADFTLQNGSTIVGLEGQASVRINSAAAVNFEQVLFSVVGLELMGKGGVTVSDCSFTSHDGSTAAALYFISAGAPSLVERCTFINCKKAAIGSAANAPQPLTIKDCTLTWNSSANNNIPQINVTAADPLVISGTTVVGIPENNMVGGIGISNFMGYNADVTISGCRIEDNRYGIGLVGPAAKILLEGNTLMNNRYETNPMNGGSGISLYDPYQQTCAVVTSNHIEGSLWGITVIGCQDVNIGCLEEGDNYNPGQNVFRDNGFDGQLYDLYNNSTLTIYAQNNTWNVAEQTEEQIESVIFHHNDDASLGEVIFMPAATVTAVSPSTLQKSPTASRQWFNLQGQRVDMPARQGVYIVGGRKVLR